MNDDATDSDAPEPKRRSMTAEVETKSAVEFEVEGPEGSPDADSDERTSDDTTDTDPDE